MPLRLILWNSIPWHQCYSSAQRRNRPLQFRWRYFAIIITSANANANARKRGGGAASAGCRVSQTCLFFSHLCNPLAQSISPLDALIDPAGIPDKARHLPSKGEAFVQEGSHMCCGRSGVVAYLFTPWLCPALYLPPFAEACSHIRTRSTGKYAHFC